MLEDGFDIFELIDNFARRLQPLKGCKPDRQMNLDIAESLAHQMRGMTIMYFLLWSVYLFRSRKQSRMMALLFLSSICLFLGFLKDSIFILDSCKSNGMADIVVGIIDMSVGMLVCNFFREAVKPSSTKAPLIWLVPLVYLLFIPLCICLPGRTTVFAASVTGSIIVLVTLIQIMVYALRHKRYIEQNYSCNDDISVRWVVVCSMIYISFLVSYTLLFTTVTWLSEVVFCALCMVLWTYIFYTALHHKVVPVSEEENAEIHEASEDKALSSDAGQPLDAAQEEGGFDGAFLLSIRESVEQSLRHCMEDEKLYLNPGLSLKNVASSIGSNTKYLSVYLNKCLGITFYDYINSFRVREAQTIIETMAVGERLNMADVALKSGFNSVSTFNRYFRKVTGMNPKDYYKEAEKSIV